jgi:hypothetical protein
MKRKPVEPLPCPFCAKAPTVDGPTVYDPFGSWGVACRNLGCHINAFVNAYSRAVAVRRWNRRKP